MNKIVPLLAVFLIAATYFFLVPDEHPANSSLSMTAVSNVSGRQTAEKSESDFAGIFRCANSRDSCRHARSGRESGDRT